MNRYIILTVMLKYGYVMLILHCYLINSFVNSEVYDSEQSVLNDSFTVVSIVKSTFKESNSTIRYFLK